MDLGWVFSWARREAVPHSADVRAHLEYLNRVASSNHRISESAGLLGRQLGAAESELSSPRVAVADREVADRRHALQLLQAELASLAGTHDEIESRVRRAIQLGDALLARLSSAEADLADAVRAEERARREYEDRSWLEDVPIVDGIERMVRDDSALSAAESRRRNVERCLRDLGEEWLALLRSLLGRGLDDPGRVLDERVASTWENATVVNVTRQRNFRLWEAGNLESIDLTDVQQGAIGNCFFAATMAALANSKAGRLVIANMIRDNGDGTFTVTFPGPPPRTVTVDGDLYFADGTPATSGSVPKDYWYLIIEKAYAAIKGSYDVLHKGGDASVVIDELGLSGGFVDTTAMTDSQLALELGGVLRGQVIVASIDIRKLFAEHAGKDKRQGHALSVTDVNLNADPPTVTMRNPWGHNNRTLTELAEDLDVKLDGDRITMPLSAFAALADGVSVSGVVAP